MTPNEIALRALGALKHHSRDLPTADKAVAYGDALTLIQAELTEIEAKVIEEAEAAQSEPDAPDTGPDADAE